MKQFAPLAISLLVVGGTIACGKGTDSTSGGSQSQSAAVSVPAGTKFEVTVPAEISTGKNKDQDRLTLPIKTPLVGGNAMLKGGKVEAHLENVVKAARGKKASLHLVFDEITLKNSSASPLDVKLLNTKVETKTKGQFLKNAGIILGGAVVGNFVGDKAKKKHGGLAGAAAATAFVLASPGGEVVLKKGTELELQLKSPIESTSTGS
jgi:hypothetical protein